MQDCIGNSLAIELPRTKRFIKLFKQGPGFYISTGNMICVLEEIFKRKMPKGIDTHIKNILTIEQLRIPELSENMICINSVDVNIIENIGLWIKNNPEYSENNLENTMFWSVEQEDNENADSYKISELFRYIDQSSGRIDFKTEYTNNYTNDYKTEYKNDYINDYKTEYSGKNGYKIDELFRFGCHNRRQVQIKKTCNNYTPVASASINDRPFTCNFKNCKRAFKRLEHMKRHQKMHTGERPFACTYPGCNKLFARSDNLSAHYKIHIIKKKKKNEQQKAVIS